MTIQVPEPVGSSGQFLESFIVSSSQHRQVLVLGNSANTAVAPVTTSGGLRTNVSSGVLSISSGVVTLSSMAALSSGIVTLSCVHTVTATAATNPWSSAPSFEIPVALSSGVVTLSSAPLVIVASSGGTIPVTLSTVFSLSSDPTVVLSSPTSLSSGTVTLSSAPLVIVASSGGTIPVTLSTVVSLSSVHTVTATAATNPWSSAPSFNLQVVSASSQAYTPYMTVTSSSGAFSTNIKGTPGRLFGYAIFNSNAAARYFKFFNTSSEPTLGTATPVMTLLIPGSTAGAGAVQDITRGIDFSAGLSIGITDAVGTTSTGSITAGDIAGNVYYT